MSAEITAAILVAKWEGFESKPYLCPAGVPTIGYGFTYYPDGRRVKLTDPEMTREHAAMVLAWLIANRYEPIARRLCPNAARPVLVAVVDFVYNLGQSNFTASTLRRKLILEDWPGARVEFLRWVRAGGRVMRGLQLRRMEEAALTPN